MEIVEEELQLQNPKDAVCIPPIPLPHMHSGFLCLSGGSFMVAALTHLRRSRDISGKLLLRYRTDGARDNSCYMTS